MYNTDSLEHGRKVICGNCSLEKECRKVGSACKKLTNVSHNHFSNTVVENIIYKALKEVKE